MRLPESDLVNQKASKMDPIDYFYDGLNGDTNYGWKSQESLDSSDEFLEPIVPSANDFFDSPSDVDNEFWI